MSLRADVFAALAQVAYYTLVHLKMSDSTHIMCVYLADLTLEGRAESFRGSITLQHTDDLSRSTPTH